MPRRSSKALAARAPGADATDSLRQDRHARTQAPRPSSRRPVRAAGPPVQTNPGRRPSRRFQINTTLGARSNQSGFRWDFRAVRCRTRMALTFRPRPGTLLICNAATCFKPNPRSAPFELGTQRILGEVGHVVAPSLWSDWTGCWSTRPAGECSSRQGSRTKTWTRSAKEW